MIARLRALIAKEFLAILRDKKSRVVLIVPPIMQLFIFSYAATFEVNNVALAVFNEDIGPAGRELVARFTGAPAFNLFATLTRESEMAEIVDSGRVSLVLHLNQDFSRNLAIGETAKVQAIVDGRRSNVGLVVLGYAQAIVREFSLDWAASRGRAIPPARLVMRSWFNPNLSSQWFIIPGLVALLTMLVTVLMTAMSIARERELGTFEQLLVTPLRPFEIMIGKIVPAVALGLTEGTIIVIFAISFFEVPFAGSLVMLYLSLSVFLLSVVGFGQGNYQDGKMEQLSNKGNGNYAYIDTKREARKVFVDDMLGTLHTIAKDVKIQVDFNPAQINAYRLIGYVNRKLAKEDFNDDRKDAGEIGAGHTVTALYEIVPAGVKFQTGDVDDSKYQRPAKLIDESKEWLTVKLRYKETDGDKSTLVEVPFVGDGKREFEDASSDFRFASSVAGFGMILRDSAHKGELTMGEVIEIARNAKSSDPRGLRSDFVELARKAKSLLEE